MPLNIDPNIANQLREASRTLHDTLPILDAAERAGIDVSQLREHHNNMRRQIDVYNQEFFNAPIRP
jgi:hypothetical protein